MAFGSSKNKKKMEEMEEKVLDVDASMQGKICFKDPVNLKINGEFEGNLDTKGKLMINDGAVVNAEINGEIVEVSGTVNGNIVVSESLKLKSSAKVIGNVSTPVFSVDEGAVFNGKCEMETVKITNENKKSENKISEVAEEIVDENLMEVGELSEYIDIDKESILKLVEEEKIPVRRVKDNLRFNKVEIDKWISSG